MCVAAHPDSKTLNMLQQFFHITKSATLRRALVLLMGAVGSQAIAFALSPVLTRLYDPKDFGILSVFTAVAGLVSVVASLGLDVAIVVERDQEEARSVFGLSIWISVVVTGLTIVIASGVAVAGLLGNWSYAVLAMLPLSVLLLANMQVLIGRALALGRNTAVALGRFFRSVGVGVAQITMALLGAQSATLVGGAVIGQLVTVFVLLKSLKGSAGPTFSAVKMRHSAKRYASMLCWWGPQTILNSAAVAAVPLVLSFYFDSSVVGLFAIADRVVQVPAITLGEVLRQSLLKSASDLADDHEAFRKYILRYIVGIGALFVLSALVFFFVAPQLFSFVFGSAWSKAGVFAGYLYISQAAGIINIPAVTAITVLGRQRSYFFFQILNVSFRFGALILAATLGDPTLTLASFAVVGAIMSLGYTAWLVLSLQKYGWAK